MSLFDEENKNFYKASVCIIQHGSGVLRRILTKHLEDTWTSLPEFLLRHQHSIFHMIHKGNCCQCSGNKPLFFSGYLLKCQWFELFNPLGPTYKCTNTGIRSSIHVCSRNGYVKHDILPRSLDISVLANILLNIKEFHLAPKTRQAVFDIRRLCNEVISYGTSGKITDGVYQIITGQVTQTVCCLAEQISTQYSQEMMLQMTSLLKSDVSLPALVDVVTIMRKANDRDLKFLWDMQNLTDFVSDSRSGELMPMMDYAAELVIATLGQGDLLLKELQNIKLLLTDRNYSEVLQKMDKRMENVYQIRKQVEDTLYNILKTVRVMNPESWCHENSQSLSHEKSKVTTQAVLYLNPCGRNVKNLRSRRRCHWQQEYSGGFVFSHRHYKTLEVLTLRLSGSGNVGIGIIQTDPQYLDKNLEKILNEEVTFGVNVKLYKSCVDVTVRCGGDGDNGKVFLDYKQQKYAITKDARKNTWLAVYIRFGDVRVELVPDSGKTLRFNDVKGDNTQFIEGNKRMVRLIDENPAAICRLSRRIHCGEEVTLYVKPLKNKDGLLKFSLDLGLTSEGMQNGSFHDDDPFTTASRTWHIRKHLGEHDCPGKIHIAVSLSGHVTMITTRGVRGNALLCPEDRLFGVAVIFRNFLCDLEIVGFKLKTT